MKRRQYLATSSLGLLSVGGGCTAIGSGRGVPDGMSVETRHWAESLLKDGITARLGSGRQGPLLYETLLTGKETAAERLQQDAAETARTFVADTDFEHSYLAVVEYFGTSSSYWLELRSLERQESGIHVVVELESPRSRRDDLASHSLVIRITDDNAETPAEISAEAISCALIRCTDLA